MNTRKLERHTIYKKPTSNAQSVALINQTLSIIKRREGLALAIKKPSLPFALPEHIYHRNTRSLTARPVVTISVTGTQHGPGKMDT